MDEYRVFNILDMAGAIRETDLKYDIDLEKEDISQIVYEAVNHKTASPKNKTAYKKMHKENKMNSIAKNSNTIHNFPVSL